VVEADEMYQNAGEKGEPHRDPDDPPRRRANQFNGHGTYDNDRPPIRGVLGRSSGEVVLQETHRSTRKELHPRVVATTRDDATVNTDEWHAYDPLSATGRGHATVNHNAGEYARDDDGDGVREVHCNTIEGHWTGLRNFLRMFRGVHKRYLGQYVAFYQCMHNFRTDVFQFIETLLGCFTRSGP
jgi:transposase